VKHSADGLRGFFASDVLRAMKAMLHSTSSAAIRVRYRASGVQRRRAAGSFADHGLERRHPLGADDPGVSAGNEKQEPGESHFSRLREALEADPVWR
jgi:hypothetical protein